MAAPVTLPTLLSDFCCADPLRPTLITRIIKETHTHTNTANTPFSPPLLVPSCPRDPHVNPSWVYHISMGPHHDTSYQSWKDICWRCTCRPCCTPASRFDQTQPARCSFESGRRDCIILVLPD